MFQYKPKQNILNKKIILITGSGDGIGREAAITFARFGASIILVGKTKKKLDAVSLEIKKLTTKESYVYTLDLLTATNEKYKNLAKNISKTYKYLDGVIHNAGILGTISSIKDQPINVWNKVIQVNLNGVFILTKVLLPLLMKAQNPSLVFTSSTAGKKCRAGWGAYAVSKFATEGLMKILSKEYKKTNLRINCINPGAVYTKMRKKAFPLENSSILKKPIDIMPIYIYLMSNDSLKKTGISFDAQK
ncbi:YciK family oxidoreductase [Candidatus Providencia siddallii]|uniref:Uncharacterized oxidoreductase YciK n=1 Tax=Candidatus Providencia siddallii TaxID=1715285 RepID=A0ABP1CDK7_9GAMM